MKYIHSAGVVHRDLEPRNILINEKCDLKICDFGLARVQAPHMMGNVSTSYYQATEIMLAWKKYNEQVDIWSAGCIFAEMLQGKPLFPGQDHAGQFRVITEVLGTPPGDVIAKITTQIVSMIAAYMRHQRRDPRKCSVKPWFSFIPTDLGCMTDAEFHRVASEA
jgi:p38 MAP kinase